MSRKLMKAVILLLLTLAAFVTARLTHEATGKWVANKQTPKDLQLWLRTSLSTSRNTFLAVRSWTKDIEGPKQVWVWVWVTNSKDERTIGLLQDDRRTFIITSTRSGRVPPP